MYRMSDIEIWEYNVIESEINKIAREESKKEQDKIKREMRYK